MLKNRGKLLWSETKLVCSERAGTKKDRKENDSGWKPRNAQKNEEQINQD